MSTDQDPTARKKEIIRHLPIITDRLILRVPTVDDVEVIHAAKISMWHDLQLWMSWAYDSAKDIDSTRKFLETGFDYETPNLPLVAFRRDTGDFAVATGMDVDQNDFGILSTGYWVPKNQQGLGFATEATAAVLKFAFDVGKARTVRICYHEGNEKSRRVIEKLGFTFVEAKLKTDKRCLDGKLIDVFEYEMTDARKIPSYKIEWRQT